MSETDVIRLQHMRDAAREAVIFTTGKIRADLEQDRMLVLALIKSLEIIGEAAGKVSDTTRAVAPAIPWSAIIAMRNRLVHGYFDVNLDIVWNTVSVELPVLIPRIEEVVVILQQASEADQGS